MKVFLRIFPVVLAAFISGCAGQEPLSQYQRPLNSPGNKYSNLPPAVQNAIRAEAGAAEIDDIRKVTEYPNVIYEVQFRDPAVFPPLYVRSDGSVLSSNLSIAVGAAEDPIGTAKGAAVSGLKLSDLPVAVVNTIREKATTSEVVSINKITLGERVYYEITFKNGVTHPAMLVADDGTILKRAPE